MDLVEKIQGRSKTQTECDKISRPENSFEFVLSICISRYNSFDAIKLCQITLFLFLAELLLNSLLVYFNFFSFDRVWESSFAGGKS